MRHPLRPLKLQRSLIGFALSLLIVVSVGVISAGVISSGSVATAQTPVNPSSMLPSPLRQIETNLTTLHGWLDSSAPKVARELIWLDGRRLFNVSSG